MTTPATPSGTPDAGPPPLYRIHLKPGGGSYVDPSEVWDYCQRLNIIGVGWRVSITEGEELDWPTYQERWIGEQGGRVNASVKMLHGMPEGALVWSRTTKGEYWLARVVGPWRYLHSDGGDYRLLALTGACDRGQGRHDLPLDAHAVVSAGPLLIQPGANP